MAYGKNRRKRRVNKTKAKYNTGAKAQSTQIIKLQRQVDSLSVATKDMYISAFFSNGDSFRMYDGLGPIGSGTGSNSTNPTFYLRELFNPQLLTPVFTTTAAFDKNNKVRVKSMIYKGKIGCSLDPDINSPAITPTYVQMWIVSLKKETGRQLLNDTTQLNQVKFNEQPNGYCFSYQNVNTHVGDSNVGRRGNAMLNTQFFNIRAYRSFTVGNDVVGTQPDTHVGNITDVAKSFSIKVRMNNVVRSGTGGTPWKQLVPAELALADRMWVIYSVCRPYSNQASPLQAPNQSPLNVSSNTMYKIVGSQ